MRATSRRTSYRALDAWIWDCGSRCESVRIWAQLLSRVRRCGHASDMAELRGPGPRRCVHRPLLHVAERQGLDHRLLWVRVGFGVNGAYRPSEFETWRHSAGRVCRDGALLSTDVEIYAAAPSQIAASSRHCGWRLDIVQLRGVRANRSGAYLGLGGLGILADPRVSFS